MRKSNVKVEQIIGQSVVNDYGEILNLSELRDLITRYFPNTFIKGDGTIVGSYNKCEYNIIFKNISYLGIPHPLYKKRIQIPREFKRIYDFNKRANIYTFIIGVYKYKDTVLFCDFNIEGFFNRKINNSSAHVHTIDLLNGKKFGIFTKNDIRNNEITVFDPYNVIPFLNSKLGSKKIDSEMFDTLDKFFDSIYKEWDGIECYSEMISNNYKNKYQGEWPGFYLEYLFEKYIKKNNLSDVVRFYQNKKKNGIDLDLYFPGLNSFGDLKLHSATSIAIQGNDLETIYDLTEDQSVYYIVCNHETNKDKDYNFEVTKYWNSKQSKSDLLSYGNKMKHDVKLKSYYVLEINKYNREYLKIFKQGKNSNGKKRKPKIMISNRDINNFLIHVVEFENID